MRGAPARLGALLSVTAFAVACGSTDEISRDDDGQRLPVLVLEDEIAADPALAGRPLVLPAPDRNADWPQAGGHPTHVMQHLALPETLERVWRRSAGAGSARRGRRITAAPVVAGEILYAMDSETVVSAFRTGDGARVWRQSFAPSFEGGGGAGGGIAAEAGVLYVATGYGDVAAVAAADGAQLWQAHLGVPLRGAPTVGDGRVYVLSHNNQLHALDAASGQLLWTHVGIQEVSGLLGSTSPALGSGLVLAPYSSGEVVALRPENGRVVWIESLSRSGQFTTLAELSDVGLPTLYRGLAIMGSHAGRTVAVDVQSGFRVWEQDIASVETPWVAGDQVFLVSVNSEVIALSREDGRIRWVTRLPQFKDPDDRKDPILWSGPVLAGNRLLLASSSGVLIELSPHSGEVLHSRSLDAGVSVTPVVANGSLYVLTDNASIYAFR